MKISLFLRVLPVCLLFCASLETGLGFEVEGSTWVKGSHVVMHLGLGSNSIPLQDGMASWNASAADALDIWNGYLDFISISSVSAPTVPQTSGDGVSSVFFSSTVFGDSFGEDALAVTVLKNARLSVLGEADVIFNTANRLNSYRGPQQLGVYDFHRIALHEFGHVIGLDHNSAPPLGTKLMEPIISDLDHLGADDVAGARSLEGAEITYLPESVGLRLGDTFSLGTYDTNNNPTSFTATGLPPGITINPITGHVNGTALKGGVYGPVIAAHGPFAAAYGTFPMTVHGLDEIPGLLAIFPLAGRSLVADPIRPRIYVAGTDGIKMIDTASFAATTVLAAKQGSSLLSISADASTLLYTKYGTPIPTEYRIDLESLSVLPSFPIPADSSAISEGLDHRSYVAGKSAVYQFDSTTGELQQSFASANTTADSGFAISLSADRRTLVVTQEYNGGSLSTYDVSGPIPVLLHQLSGSYSRPVVSPDGKFVYAAVYSTGNDGQHVVQVPLPDLVPARSFGSDFWIASIAVALDGSIYEAHSPVSFLKGPTSIYDPVSLQLEAVIDPDDINPTMYPYSMGSGVFDKSGQLFFASVFGSEGEVWAFSTDLPSLPPFVSPTKHLLNISTRVRVESGENAMIGGFIVQGSEPKKVLIRGLGPSLPITGAMANPVLDLHDAAGNLVASNDDWTSSRLGILGSQLAPASPRESAILATLAPGSYTAVVRDHDNQPGLALAEIYDLDPKDSLLANISTRGKVGAGDNVMIGGFIISGQDPTKVLIRAIGPSLAGQGIAQPLADPVLELHNADGGIIATNDNWRATQQTDIVATGIPPSDNRESAILMTLDPGSYTAIVRGNNGTTGVALVEVYNLDLPSNASK